MSRIPTLFRRDLLSSIRSPALIWLIMVPFAVTFLLRVVFATLLEPSPRLGLYFEPGSRVAPELLASGDLVVMTASSPERLERMVADGETDAGLSLDEDFETRLLAGDRPFLDLTVSDGSDPVSRILILLSVMDALRGVTGGIPPLQVMQVSAGPERGSVPVSAGLVPGVVMLVLIVSGIFVPAYLIVVERESGTLTAVLVTPARLREVLLSKALLGFILTVSISMVTLALNGVPGSLFPKLLLTVSAGAVMCCILGVIYGTLAKDVKTLYTMVKSLNVLLAGPIAFYLVSGVPEWLAMVFPTYWFIDPLYRIILERAGFGSIIPELGMAMTVSLLLAVPMVLLSRRMAGRVSAGGR